MPTFFENQNEIKEHASRRSSEKVNSKNRKNSNTSNRSPNSTKVGKYIKKAPSPLNYNKNGHVATDPGHIRGPNTQGTDRVKELKKTNSASFVFGEEEIPKNTFNEGKLL